MWFNATLRSATIPWFYIIYMYKYLYLNYDEITKSVIKQTIRQSKKKTNCECFQQIYADGGHIYFAQSVSPSVRLSGRSSEFVSAHKRRHPWDKFKITWQICSPGEDDVSLTRLRVPSQGQSHCLQMFITQTYHPCVRLIRTCMRGF